MNILCGLGWHKWKGKMILDDENSIYDSWYECKRCGDVTHEWTWKFMCEMNNRGMLIW